MCSKAEEKSKVVCKVCGSELELTKKNHYVVADNLKTGIITALATTTEEQWYDAFDCPTCGCQYIAGERKRKVRNVIFRELQEDLVSDNVIGENVEEIESDNSDFDCFGNCNENCTIPVTCEKYYECLISTPIKGTEENKELCELTPDAIEREIELTNERDAAYPICIGDQELVEENGEECRTCNSREECVKRIKESNEQIGKEWEDIWDDDEEF